MKFIFTKIEIKLIDGLFFGVILTLIIYPFRGFDILLFSPIILGLIIPLLIKFSTKFIRNRLFISLVSAGLVSVACSLIFKFVFNINDNFTVFTSSILIFIALIICTVKVKIR